jgi:hypothetical protein
MHQSAFLTFVMAADSSNPPNLWTLLHETRQIHESLLRKSLGHRQTKGSCAYAAYMLDVLIKRFRPDLSSCIRGGDGVEDGGYFDDKGRGFGHYWVEIDDKGQRFVADITADQFGAEPIQLLPLSATAGSYIPGNAELVAEQMAEFGEGLREAAQSED